MIDGDQSRGRLGKCYASEELWLGKRIEVNTKLRVKVFRLRRYVAYSCQENCRQKRMLRFRVIVVTQTLRVAVEVKGTIVNI